MKVFTFNKDYGKTRDLPKYLFLLALSFSYINGFLEVFRAPLLKWSCIPLPSSSLFAEALNPAALKWHSSPLSFLPKHDNWQRPWGYNYSLPSFHWIELLPYGSMNSVKENTLKQEESQKTDSLFLWRREVAESGKKRSKWGQRKVNKMKDSSKQKYLSPSQMLLHETGSRCFIRQVGHLVTQVHSITHVKP